MQRTLRATNSLLSSIKRAIFQLSDSFGYQQGLQLERITVSQFPHLEGEVEDEKTKGFLWGVPKKRRTIEKRLMRKFGWQDFFWKPYKLKTNIKICDTCGHHYQIKHLCRNCYDKVIAETKAIREAAEIKFGDSPENQNVVVLYENELQTVEPGQLKDKMIVEISKPRPAFFSKNLLQKTTVGINTEETTVTTDSTTIKPLS